MPQPPAVLAFDTFGTVVDWHGSIAREIRALEDQGDTISDEVQRHLYDGVNDVPGMIRAMRGGEIVALIEDASDQAQRVAKTVESILLKNA